MFVALGYLKSWELNTLTGKKIEQNNLRSAAVGDGPEV